MNRISINSLEEMTEKDSGVRLLRAKSAPLVIVFLYNTFHVDTISAMPSIEFSNKLEEFLKENSEAEEILEEELEAESNETLFENEELEERVKRYISTWLGEDKRYIRRYRNAEKIEIIELDTGVSRLFSYISKILSSDSISTETSFNYVLFQLNNLAENLNDDPERRIKELELKKKAIDEEIKRIERTGEVKTFTPRETIETLKDIENRGKELISDFSQVEDNFRSIIRETMDKQNEINISKNKVFAYALSLNYELTKTNQWQSFNAFWSYMRDNKDDRISSLAESIKGYLDANEDKREYDTSFLMALRKILFESGKKIVDRNSALTQKMSRVMASTTKADRKGLDEIISRIMNESKRLREKPEKEANITIEIDEGPELMFPMSRILQQKKSNSNIKAIEFKDEETSLDAILSLKREFHIDEKELKDKISMMFHQNGNMPFTLKELSERYPIEKGLEEIITYILLAEKSGYRDENAIEEIIYSFNERKYKVRLPRIVFIRK